MGRETPLQPRASHGECRTGLSLAPRWRRPGVGQEELTDYPASPMQSPGRAAKVVATLVAGRGVPRRRPVRSDALGVRHERTAGRNRVAETITRPFGGGSRRARRGAVFLAPCPGLCIETLAKSPRRPISALSRSTNSRAYNTPDHPSGLLARGPSFGRGHFNYYGLSGNSRAINCFRYEACRLWRKWLSRRSQRARLTWEKFNRMLRHHPLPPARLPPRPRQYRLANL